jgi:hypothetical protein
MANIYQHLSSKISRVIKLPPHIIWRRMRQKVYHQIRCATGWLRARWLTTPMSDAELQRSLAHRFSTVQDFLKHRSVAKAPFLIGQSDHQQALLTTIRRNCPHVEPLTISAADQVCNHVFDLLGSGPTYLGDKIDWHIDFKSGRRFDPRQYHANVRPASYPGGYDIKVPWELSRCQHFAWLGQAYWLTRDEKYTHEFIAQIEDWLDNNPWPWGVNWACTMDVSIRVVNWLWGYHFFTDSPSLTDEFRLTFYKAMLRHGRHIFHNLENQGPLTTNHYLANLVGLIYLGILCPEFKESPRWLAFGLNELEKEMFQQVYADGVSFEASTSYHRLALELFLSATILGQHNGHRFSVSYMQRLEKMVEFVLYLTKPDGTVPLIGDNDNGRLHRLKIWDPPEREWNDFRYLLAIGAVLFQREDFALAAGDQWEEAIWLWGENAWKFKQQVDAQQRPPLQLASRAFPDAGLYIMRHDHHYMVVDAGPHGQHGNGGHAHNDTLSIEMYAADQTWILDPGTAVYTLNYQESNLFRSTAYHNTLRVGGHEMNRLDAHELFQMHADAHPYVREWHSTATFDFIDAEHNGYGRLPASVIHRRQIYFDKRECYWLIFDLVTGHGDYLLEQFFHFPSVHLQVDSDDPLAVWANAGQDQTLLVQPLSQDGLVCQTSETMISPGYGLYTVGQVICYRRESKASTELITLLYPHRILGSRQLLMQQWLHRIEQIKSGSLKDLSHDKE